MNYEDKLVLSLLLQGRTMPLLEELHLPACKSGDTSQSLQTVQAGSLRVTWIVPKVSVPFCTSRY